YKETECYSITPIAVQACLRFRRLALHFCIGSTYAAKHKDVRKRPNRSHGYAFRSKAAPTNTSNGTGMYRLWSKGRNPAPAPAILGRNASLAGKLCGGSWDRCWEKIVECGARETLVAASFSVSSRLEMLKISNDAPCRLSRTMVLGKFA
ncbi:MAG: hypothetical protein PVJ72_15425, partial [Gammaproteobacteria bacterium]